MGALVRSLVVRALGAVILPAEPKPGIRSEAPSELRADGEVDSRKLCKVGPVRIQPGRMKQI